MPDTIHRLSRLIDTLIDENNKLKEINKMLITELETITKSKEVKHETE